MNSEPNDRHELAKLFIGEGVELGVAEGNYSLSILRHSQCSRLWSIDRWSDHHDVGEYKRAADALVRAGNGRCVPLRMAFSEAIQLFGDASLDFIYIDGYAHTGQESGQTLRDWWSKLRVGGMFVGHDYHPQWPLTVQAVDEFAASHAFKFQTTRETKAESQEFPSWWGIKEK